MIVIGTQNTGILVIASFNALLYQSLGLTNSQALIVSAAYNTWGMIANFIGAPISDRFGRRKLLRMFLFRKLRNGVWKLIKNSDWIHFQYSDVRHRHRFDCQVHRDPDEELGCRGTTFLFLYVFWSVYSIGATFRIKLTSS